MRRFIILVFLGFVGLCCYPQDLKSVLESKLNQVGKDIPSDQIFIHSDRNLYHAGDTIWFRTWIRDSRTGIFTTESISLFVLLLNPEHSTVDSSRFRIIEATVSGWLKVPDDAPEGDYSMLAFTSNDMSYDPKYAYSMPLRIDKIIHDQDEPVEGLKDETVVAGGTGGQLPAPDLRFLPEGGTFINGLRQRLAFIAVSPSGKNLIVKGQILNQLDKVITSFSSGQYGPGLLEFTPSGGDTYYATLEGQEFKGIKWSLPFAQNAGVTLRVEDIGDEFRDIIVRGMNPGAKSYFLTVTMNNILVFSEDITPDDIYRKKIQTDKLPSGTAYVTLYDRELNPVAERLIFLNGYKKMQVNINVVPSSAFPGDETELIVNTTDFLGLNLSSRVSVAVVDSITGYYNGIALPDITSTCLYDQGFYDNLPFSLKAQGPGTVDENSLDILLMTYGWRSFHPVEIAVDDITREIEDYDMLRVINTGKSKKSRQDIKLIPDDGLDIITLPLDERREATLSFDSLGPGTRQILILPDKDPARNKDPVDVLFPENKGYTGKAKIMADGHRFINPDKGEIYRAKPEFNIGDVIVIEPVTIRAPKQEPKAYEDKYARMFQYAGTRTMTSKDYKEAFSFEDILFKLNPFFINVDNWYTGGLEKQVYLRGNEHIAGASSGGTKGLWGQNVQATYSGDSKMLPALFVLDGSQIGLSYETIATIPASNIVSVTIMKGSQGFALYGQKAMGGVIFITTKFGAGIIGNSLADNESQRNDDLLKEIRIFRTEAEYYIPTKEEIHNDPRYNLRSTILWQSQVMLDGTGPVSIKFPNNRVKGRAIVRVNGVSYDNRVGFGSSSYKIR